jgi:hypothetical protein
MDTFLAALEALRPSWSGATAFTVEEQLAARQTSGAELSDMYCNVFLSGPSTLLRF